MWPGKEVVLHVTRYYVYLLQQLIGNQYIHSFKIIHNIVIPPKDLKAKLVLGE